MNESSLKVTRQNKELRFQNFIGAGIDTEGNLEFVSHNLDLEDMEVLHEKLEILIRIAKKECEERLKKH